MWNVEVTLGATILTSHHHKQPWWTDYNCQPHWSVLYRPDTFATIEMMTYLKIFCKFDKKTYEILRFFSLFIMKYFLCPRCGEGNTWASSNTSRADRSGLGRRGWRTGLRRTGSDSQVGWLLACSIRGTALGHVHNCIRKLLQNKLRYPETDDQGDYRNSEI